MHRTMDHHFLELVRVSSLRAEPIPIRVLGDGRGGYKTRNVFLCFPPNVPRIAVWKNRIWRSTLRLWESGILKIDSCVTIGPLGSSGSPFLVANSPANRKAGSNDFA